MDTQTAVHIPDQVQPKDPAAQPEVCSHLNNTLEASQVPRGWQGREHHQSVLHTDGVTTVPSVGKATKLDITGKENDVLCNNVLLVASPPLADVPGHTGPDSCDNEARRPILDNIDVHTLTERGNEDDILAMPDRLVAMPDRPAAQAGPGSTTPPGTTAAGTCSHTESGVCHIHGQAQKMFKPGRKWAKGKDGLYSWKYCKKWEFTCTKMRKKTTAKDSHPPTPIQKPTFLMLRDSGEASDAKKRNSRGNKMKTKPNQVTAETGSNKKF